MLIQIKNRFSGLVIFEHDCEKNTIKLTLKKAIKAKTNLRSADLRSADLRSAELSYANLRYADLSSADLRSADLRYANLSSADLRYAKLSSAILSSADLSSADLRCMGDMRFIFTMQLDTWHIGFTADTLQIGCQRHAISDWLLFDDERIESMGQKALAFWRKWKDFILKAIELSIPKVEE